MMTQYSISSSVPLVSVHCMAYNHEKYIRNALDGFVMQEAPFPFEVIIHDDASTDNTANIIREYETMYPHIIKPIYQTENQYSKKVSITKNFLLPKSQGKYIALCEGDDYWIDKHKLFKQVRYLEKHPECSATFHPVNYIVDGKINNNDKYWNEEIDITTGDAIIRGGYFIATCSIVYRKEIALLELPFLDMPGVGDYKLQVLLAANGKVHYLPDIMGCYRYLSSGSYSVKFNEDREFRAKIWMDSIKWLIQFNKDTDYKHQFPVSVKIYSVLQSLNQEQALPENSYMYKVYSETHNKMQMAQAKILEPLTLKLSKGMNND